ncbi:SprT family zinc-dependent metalloprotease [uncultured Microbacterium sp.]|uniref:M48 family metallopeptidase n=1 Tax=uncultured Microbacterium sp. TaxID=191216 RepID=UPI002627DA1E|nr:SprT family zinc-dependent metalloprotease [uncultured Microbacterium sp.]
MERRERSTLAITVLPSTQVQVIAPLNATDEEISKRVRKRGRWVLSQQEYFAQFLPHTPPRRWLPGETHRYLGRQYRLRIEADSSHLPPSVKLRGRFFMISGVRFSDSVTIEMVLTDWYRDHASIQLPRRLDACIARFPSRDSYMPTAVQLRTMRTRWASMSPSGRLTLNPALVQAPIDCIDYVVTHELCHRAVPDHSSEFHALLAEVMPDWEDRKARLELAMA